MKVKPEVKPRVCGGIFSTDPAYPHAADAKGRRVCTCGLVGEAGDSHHTLPDVPEQAAHRQRIGERADD